MSYSIQKRRGEKREFQWKSLPLKATSINGLNWECDSLTTMELVMGNPYPRKLSEEGIFAVQTKNRIIAVSLDDRVDKQGPFLAIDDVKESENGGDEI